MGDPTPGQVAYEAYQQAYAVTYAQWRQRGVGEDHYGDASAYAWHRQVDGVRAAWEAAAEAVRTGGTMSDTPITDQVKDILLLVGTILHQGTQQDLDKLHLWLADYAEVVTSRRQTGAGDEVPHA